MFFLPPLCEPLKEGRVRHLEQESLKTKQIEPGASEEIEGWGGGLVMVGWVWVGFYWEIFGNLKESTTSKSYLDVRLPVYSDVQIL